MYQYTRSAHWKTGAPYPRYMAESTVPMGTVELTPQMVQQQATAPINWVRFALLMAVGAAGVAVYRHVKERRAESNPLPPWPGIGPVPPFQLGPMFWLGQAVL